MDNNDEPIDLDRWSGDYKKRKNSKQVHRLSYLAMWSPNGKIKQDETFLECKGIIRTTY